MPAAATTTMTASRIDDKLLKKAVESLLKYHDVTKNDKSLLGNDSIIQIQFGLDKVPHESSSKPKRVAIPHALWKTNDDDEFDGIQEPSVCLIVKEESKEWVQELIGAFPKEMGFVKKVLGLDSLRKKHAKFEQQRALLHRFDIFMADNRILPMLGKSLGKHFFETKKQPIPVQLTRKTALPMVILQSLRSTFWYLSEGTCLTVKAGTTGMSVQQIVENVDAICNHIPTKVPRKWANIRSIAIKTTSSMALPIYNKTPAELKEIAKLAGIEDEEYVEDKVKDEMHENSEKKRKVEKSPLLKALKRQQEEEIAFAMKKNEDDGSPKKKRKASQEEGKVETKKPSSKKSKVAEQIDEVPKEEMKNPKSAGSTPSQDAMQHKTAKRTEVTPKGKGGHGDVKIATTSPSSKTLKVASEQIDDVPKAMKKTKTAGSKADQDTRKQNTAKHTEVTPKGKGSKRGGNDESSSKKKQKIQQDSQVTKSAVIEKNEASSTKKIIATKANQKDSAANTPKKQVLASSSTTPKNDASFIASKKHTGSKSGYVFKLGTKGLGYYVDQQPKVNPQLIEALIRSSQQGRGGGSSRKAKKTGRGRR